MEMSRTLAASHVAPLQEMQNTESVFKRVSKDPMMEARKHADN